MTKTLSALLFIFLIFAVPACSDGGEEGFRFKKNPEIEQTRPKKPLKIKLKRLKGGEYTWEITGGDVEEITKTDKRLKKLFLRKSD